MEKIKPIIIKCKCCNKDIQKMGGRKYCSFCSTYISKLTARIGYLNLVIRKLKGINYGQIKNDKLKNLIKKVHKP